MNFNFNYDQAFGDHDGAAAETTAQAAILTATQQQQLDIQRRAQELAVQSRQQHQQHRQQHRQQQHQQQHHTNRQLS